MYLDTHVHFRDFTQRHKETIQHGLEVAYDAGVDAVFDMPNTDPPLTTRKIVVERLRIAKEANISDIFYGLYMGLTTDIQQVKRAVDVYREFQQVIGMKLYAGHSVGNLGITSEHGQGLIYETLTKQGYDGVLAVHCEKESYLHPEKWNPRHPITHCYTRPEEAEIESVGDQIELAAASRFKGKLHLTHISSPRAVEMIVEAKNKMVDISCGICPHHLLYDWNKMNAEDGLLWKMNPPLREPASREKMLGYLKAGHIDWIETDHAPHSLEEKTKSPYLSGIPGIAWWPLFAEFLRQQHLSETQIEDITFNNAARRFKIDVTRSNRVLKDRRAEYPFDPYAALAQQIRWPQ